MTSTSEPLPRCRKRRRRPEPGPFEPVFASEVLTHTPLTFLDAAPRVLNVCCARTRGAAARWAVRLQLPRVALPQRRRPGTRERPWVHVLARLRIDLFLFNGDCLLGPPPEWRIDPGEFAAGVPPRLTLYVDKHTLPPNVAPMRLVATFTHDDGAQEVCWTACFEVEMWSRAARNETTVAAAALGASPHALVDVEPAPVSFASPDLTQLAMAACKSRFGGTVFCGGAGDACSLAPSCVSAWCGADGGGVDV